MDAGRRRRAPRTCWDRRALRQAGQAANADVDQPGIHEVEPVEEAQDVRARAHVDVRGDAPVVYLLGSMRDRGLVLIGKVTQHQVAAGRERVAQRGDDLPWVLGIVNEVQHHVEQQPGRLGQVDQPADRIVSENFPWFPQVGFYDCGIRASRQNGPAVGDGDLIVIRVDHSSANAGPLGDLVHVAFSGDTRADVQELADPVRGEEPDRPPEERPVVPGGFTSSRNHGDDRPGQVLICEEVVAAAQPVVVDPRHVGPLGVDVRWHPAQIVSHRTVSSVGGQYRH